MNKKELRKYKNQFDKDNYKQFKTKLKPEELDQINEFLTKNNMNKRELVLDSKKILERGIDMRKFLIVKVTQHSNTLQVSLHRELTCNYLINPLITNLLNGFNIKLIIKCTFNHFKSYSISISFY